MKRFRGNLRALREREKSLDLHLRAVTLNNRGGGELNAIDSMKREERSSSRTCKALMGQWKEGEEAKQEGGGKLFYSAER